MKLVPNLPSDEGRELGECLARFCENAKKVETDMCASCVFRRGTFANGCLATTANALKCVIEADPFYCAHERAGLVCGGYIKLRAESPGKIKMPFDFIEGASTY